jgi:multidrug efflux system outer membrane protein
MVPFCHAASQTAQTVAGLAIDRWWLHLADPSLDKLIGQALTHNHDLAQAAARVREAQSGLEEVRAARAPRLDLQAQGARARQSGDLGLPVALTRSDHQIGLSSSCEVDLWARLESGTEAARHRLLAQELRSGAPIAVEPGRNVVVGGGAA